MAGKSMMLEKKLHELESELADVIRLPLGSTAAEQMLFDSIKERIEFLEKLRAAEAESQPSQDSDQLITSIDERFARLKTTFFNWNQSRNCSLDVDDDTQSVCSDCTQSLRESDIPTRDRVKFSGHKLLEKDQTESESESEAEAEAEAEAEEAVVEGSVWSEVGKYCGVFGCGMIAGAMSIMVKVYLSEYLIPDEYFSIPPT